MPQQLPGSFGWTDTWQPSYYSHIALPVATAFNLTILLTSSSATPCLLSFSKLSPISVGGFGRTEQEGRQACLPLWPHDTYIYTNLIAYLTDIFCFAGWVFA